MRRLLASITAIAVVAAACGSDAVDVSTAPVETTVNETTTVLTTTSAPQTTTSTTPPDKLDEQDPCDSAREAGVQSHEIMVEGEARPVTIEWDAEAAESPAPVLLIGLHAAGFGGRSYTAIDDVGAQIPGPTVFVLPRADDSLAPFWSQSPTFNLTYLEALFELLDSTVCYDVERVFLTSSGQGNLVSTTAICDLDQPIVSSYQGNGPISFPDCDPPRPVAIFGTYVYEFHPNVGTHWDGPWNPPVQSELDRTGGIGPGPHDIDEWAAIYNCTDDATIETIPDPSDRLERDTIHYSYTQCDAPIHAFVFENEADGADCGCIDAEALTAALPTMFRVAATVLAE